MQTRRNPRRTALSHVEPGAALSLLFLAFSLGCSSQTNHPNGDGDDGDACAQTQTSCGGVCTDTLLDNLNCGQCSQACVPGSQCSVGGCECANAAFTACSDACLDTSGDPNNCGDCGVVCDFAQQCGSGACVCREQTELCTDGCVQVASDPDNCGTCANVCPAGQVCSLGACSDSCADGLTQCGRSCVDTNTDFANCGGCAATCGSGLECEAGVCTCPEGKEQCNGACVDVSASNLHCGACGNSCAPGASCEAGSCSCGAGQQDCGGNCTSVQTNSQHCGDCDSPCAPGLSCQGGECTDGDATCSNGLTDCSGACVDTQVSDSDCGMCGTDCGALRCVGGTCQAIKVCEKKTLIESPLIATFESYDGTQPVIDWGFSFNAPAGDPNAVYSGLFTYSDEVGNHTLSMSSGNASSYAPRIRNDSPGGAGAWGGAVGMWMGCIDASAYTGLSLAVKGPVPSGLVTLTVSMQETTPPDSMNPDAGGTCESDCSEASVDIDVTDAWSQVVIPFSAFSPGTANAASIPVTGDNITGLNFSVQLAYVEDPQNEGEYIPDTAPYDFSFDDLMLTTGTPGCSGEMDLCGTSCVDTQTNAMHCGECDDPCPAGQSCGGGNCACGGDLSPCGEQCVDTDTNVEHCGECDERCLGTCSGGECNTNACGSTDLTPFGCDFAWGGPQGTSNAASYLEFVTTWIGYEHTQGRAGDCDGCGLVDDLAGTNAIPTFYAYVIGSALPDCNVEPDSPNNLCHAGAQYIRDNWDEIVELYADYAQDAYLTNTDKPVAWLLEGDFVQYTYAEQSNPLSMSELGNLASDIVCAIKGAAPNALVAINHSPWITNEQANQFWNAMPLGSFDFVWTTGSGSNGGYINAPPQGAGSYNATTANYAWLHGKTGMGIFVDTSFGPSQQTDSWSSASASQLNARISEGVIAANVTEPPGDYQSRVTSLSSQLNSVCE